MDDDDDLDMSSFEVDDDDDDDDDEADEEDTLASDDEADTAALFDMPDSEEPPAHEPEEEAPSKINFFAALLQKLPPLPNFAKVKEKLPAMPKLKGKGKSGGKPKMSPLIKGLIVVAAVLVIVLVVLLALVLQTSRKQALEEELHKQAETDRLTALGQELDYAIENNLDIIDDSPTEEAPVKKPPTNVTIDFDSQDTYEKKLVRITERLERILEEPTEDMTNPTAASGDIYLSVLEDKDNPSRVDLSGNVDPSKIEHNTPLTDFQASEDNPSASWSLLTDGKAHVANYVQILDNNYEASRDAHAKLLEALELYRAKKVDEKAFSLYCEKAISFQYRLTYAVENDGNRNSEAYVSACLAHITAAKNAAAKITDYILMQGDLYLETIDTYIAQTAQAAAQANEARANYLRSEGFNDLEATMIGQ